MDPERKSHVRVISALILVIIIIAVFLSRVNFSPNQDAPAFQANLTYLEDESAYGWQTYVIIPSLNIWAIIVTQWQELHGQKTAIPTSVTNLQLPSVNIDIGPNNTEVYQIQKPTTDQK
jgi:hypothetical protein